MIITYQSESASQTKENDYFITYRWLKRTDSLILEQLWHAVEECLKGNLSYEETIESLKYIYKNKTVKSSAHLWDRGGQFEVIKKGVFPSIMIVKK